MQPDLAGNTRHDGARKIRVWIDESKPATSCPWLYVGLLALDVQDSTGVLADLMQARSKVGYDRELHFSSITRHDKAALAERWIDLALHDERIRFHALGIDMKKIRRSAFGSGGAVQRKNAYKRLMRSLVVYAVKTFGENTGLSSVVHDKGNLEHDHQFDWRSLWQIRRDHSLDVSADAVRFVDSDHWSSNGDSEDSHLLQLTDLLLGATRLCVENTTTKGRRVALAERWMPVVERVTDPRQRRNPNSRYRHAGRVGVSFFPKSAEGYWDVDGRELLRSAFYFERELKLKNRMQPRLF